MSRIKLVFLLTLIAGVFAQHADAQNITSALRRVRVETLARDAIFNEDDVVSSDRVVFRQTGSWMESASASSSTITGDTTADSMQLSIVDPLTNSFQLDGQVNTWSMEDGTSRSLAESFARLNFSLTSAGGVEFDQIFLEGLRPQINDDPRDDEYERSDEVVLFVRIFDQDTRVLQQYGQIEDRRYIQGF
ncbi:MAG: hypothetical protein AAF456_02610 [Planctomycetota bacterium]